VVQSGGCKLVTGLWAMSPMCVNCSLHEAYRIEAWDGECPGAAIVHAAGDFAALLHGPGSVGDRRQVVETDGIPRRTKYKLNRLGEIESYMFAGRRRRRRSWMRLGRRAVSATKRPIPEGCLGLLYRPI
jgi:hypothetical protein